MNAHPAFTCGPSRSWMVNPGLRIETWAPGSRRPIVSRSDDAHNPMGMRYEAKHKARTRERIVRNAGRKLRGKGLSGAGVAEVMKASGLTVGGFYKHFGSKDELVADAITHGFAEFNAMLATLGDVPRKDRWKEIVRLYLSPEHRDHPESGCPVAALAPEMSREKLRVRKHVTGLLQERRDILLDLMPGRNAEERERNFFVIFSAMAGAISIARIFTDPADRDRVLESTREFLLRSF